MPVYAVNPARAALGGRRCYQSVDDLPDDVSLAVVAVPATHLDDTIDSCIAKRMRGAVVITSVDGTDVDVASLVARARRNGLRIIGPSSMGIASVRPDTSVQAALVQVTLPAGHVAISMQSGSLASSLLRRARDLDLGISWFVSLGDKADVSANDLLQFWEEDTNTHVVAMYTESFGNPRKFARIARRVSRTKPIVAVRTGSASIGAASSALYQQAGVIEVPTVPALLDTARVLATQPYPRGPNIAVISNSRSPTVLAGAALDNAGLLAVESPRPLDWRSDATGYEAAIAAALDDDDIHGLLVIHAPAVERDVDATADNIHRAAHDATKPIVAVMLGGADGPLVAGSAVPAFAFPEQAAAVLGRAYAYGRWLASDSAIEPGPERAVDPEAARRVIDDVIADGRLEPRLEERRRLLAAYGMTFAMAVEATPATAVEAAAAVGYPVAIKAVKRRPGRSARSGVALDIDSPAAAEQAVGTIVDALGDDAAELVVQAMAAPGVDLRVHCEHDDRLGAVVSVGLGGVQADVIADRTSRLAPVSPAVARTMLGETRVLAALTDSDIDPSALVDVIVQAAQLASDQPRVRDLDLNPVIVSTDGTVITDATVHLVEDALTAGDDTLIRKLN